MFPYWLTVGGNRRSYSTMGVTTASCWLIVGFFVKPIITIIIRSIIKPMITIVTIVTIVTIKPIITIITIVKPIMGLMMAS